MKKIKNKFNSLNLFLKLSIIFIILITTYTVFLTLAYAIPHNLIMENIGQSLSTIQSETKRWAVLTNFDGTKLDTFTDDLIFKKMTNENNLPALEAGMWNNGYVRYWLGIISVIRPLLIFVDYSSIRYFNIFIIFGLMMIVFNKINNIVGFRYAMAFLTSLCIIHFWIFPLSLQYSPVYIIMMLSILVLLYLFMNNIMTKHNIILIFFIIGSLTNYFDLLTAPLLTLGFPFIIWFILIYRQSGRDIKETYLMSIAIALTWLGGYAMTWLFKWIIGSIILNENIFSNAFNQITVRTQGTTEVAATGKEILMLVLRTTFPKEALVVLGVWTAFWGVSAFKKNKIKQNIAIFLPLVAIAILPFVWVLVLQNHNEHHSYFTYRIFAITIFALMSFLLLQTETKDLENNNKFISRRK